MTATPEALRATAASMADTDIRRAIEARADALDAATRPPVDPTAEAARLRRLAEHPSLDAVTARTIRQRAADIVSPAPPAVDPVQRAAALRGLTGLVSDPALSRYLMEAEAASKSAGPGPEVAPSLSAADLRQEAAGWRRRAAAANAPDLAGEYIRRAIEAEQEAERIEPADPVAKPAPKPSSSPAAPAGLTERLRDQVEQIKAQQAQTRQTLAAIEKAVGR